MLLHRKALPDETVDVFANAPLALEPVVHLSCGTSDECCYMGFDFLHHAGEISCVNSIGLPGYTKPDLLLRKPPSVGECP